MKTYFAKIIGWIRLFFYKFERQDANEETQWNDLAAQEFFAGYAASDSIYDKI